MLASPHSFPLSSLRTLCCAAVVATGVVGTLIKMLQAPHVSDKLRFEALWALTNVASGTSEQCQVLVQEGALPAFVAMTKSSNAECREQAVWAIGNVAGDSEALRDETLRAGCMQAVMRLINPHNPSSVGMLRNVTWTLSNMCRGKKPLPPFEYVRHAIPAMTWLLNYDDSEVIQDAAWGLSYVSDEPGDDNYKLDVFVKQEGLLQRLAWLLENYQKQDILVVPVLRAIGNVLTGNDQQTDAVLQHGVTEALLKLLRHPKRNIRKETAWALSNITAGQPHQIEQVLGNQALVTELSRLLRSGDVVVQREAAWTIANACTCGNNRQLRFISGKEEIVSAMSDALGCGDRAIIKVICEAIVALIKFGNSQGDETFTELLEATGGLDNLEELQHHSSEDVYQSVASVFQQLQDSGNVELDQEEIATDGQTFSFGATEIGTADFGSTASTWDF